MDYKKKYEESLTLMADCIIDEDGYVHVRPQDIFPELAESRNKKVRKTLIRVLNENVGNGIEKYGAKLEEALAWLEKQGEQKPTDNDMVEALRTEYEKGRADAFAEIGEKFDDCRRRNDLLGFLEFLRLKED